MATKLEPKTVLYCQVCGLPPDFCEFGPDFEKCKPWLREHAAHYYPHLFQPAEAESAGVSSLSLDDSAASKAEEAKGAGAAKEEEVKKLPGGKVKKKEKPSVLVEKVTRNKRKCITTVKGLDLFGVKLADAAKKFGKKFASGASVVKGPTEKDQIDVQGDIMLDVVGFILTTWKEVPKDAIFLFEDGKKVPAM